jgi:thiol-disulfide isomerase/thioredoxin
MRWDAMRWFAVFFLMTPAAYSDIVADVRVAAAQGNFPLGDSLINGYRGQRGVTPEMLEAMSWLARGALDLKQFERAEGYARETETQVRAQLKRRALDSDPHLAMALGAAVEVQAQALAARAERSEALALLRKDLLAYGRTSIRARIQKNINLLTLEGKPAPPLDEREYLGGRPVALAVLQGKPVLLFFWAHWCGDCKAEAPLLAQLRREYGARGLTVIAPTQRYGYVAGGEDATPQQELQYIDAVRQRFYADLLDVPAPISEENFKLYGASTTPTLVLIDRHGIVRLYHPGAMRMDELRAALNSVL